MFFLSKKEIENWENLAQIILQGSCLSQDKIGSIRSELRPHFYYYIGTLLASHGNIEEGKEWLLIGSRNESIPSNAYLLDFINRHDNKLVIPQVTFSDPRPFICFTNVPAIKDSRNKFVKRSTKSLPAFNQALKIMDIGCGNGMLLVQLLEELKKTDKIERVADILLLDTSEKMLKLAEQNVSHKFPDAKVQVEHKSLQEISCHINQEYDIAMSALAWHHMPFETKLIQAQNLSRVVDHFLLFELEANHDSPEQFSPELAVSMYQAFGGGIALVLAQDVPKEVAQTSIDYFLMTEAVSLLTQSRKKRADHHMLRKQWHKLFSAGLGSDFKCLCDSTCYSDEYFEFYTLHYGR